MPHDLAHLAAQLRAATPEARSAWLLERFPALTGATRDDMLDADAPAGPHAQPVLAWVRMPFAAQCDLVTIDARHLPASGQQGRDATAGLSREQVERAMLPLGAEPPLSQLEVAWFRPAFEPQARFVVLDAQRLPAAAPGAAA